MLCLWGIRRSIKPIRTVVGRWVGVWWGSGAAVRMDVGASGDFPWGMGRVRSMFHVKHRCRASALELVRVRCARGSRTSFGVESLCAR